jgi:hypothetical protein
MEKDLTKLKEFLLDKNLDEDDYQDNLDYLNNLESQIRENEDFSSWQESDITKMTLRIVRDAYKEICITLFSKEDLTDSDRMKLFAKKNACIWMASLLSKDVDNEIKSIHGSIKAMLNKIDQ